MDTSPRLDIRRCFAALLDPRIERTQCYEMLDMITVAMCAVLAGADRFVDSEQYGHARRD